jgi:hypothetical protein
MKQFPAVLAIVSFGVLAMSATSAQDNLKSEPKPADKQAEAAVDDKEIWDLHFDRYAAAYRDTV